MNVDVNNKKRNDVIKIVLISLAVILLPIIIILAVIVVGALVITFLVREPRTELNKISENNAINYIENKYGFKPKVKSSKVATYSTGPFSSKKTNEYIVTMVYKNKKFEVIISSTKDSTDGYDDYEYDKIVESYKKYLNNRFNVNTYDIQFTNKNLYEDYENMHKYVKAKFDNDNYKELFKNADITIELHGINDIDSIDNYFKNELDNNINEVRVYDYTSKSKYDDYHKSKNNYDRVLYINSEYQLYSYSDSTKSYYKKYLEKEFDLGIIKIESNGSDYFDVTSLEESDNKRCYSLEYNRDPNYEFNSVFYFYLDSKSINMKKYNYYLINEKDEKRAFSTYNSNSGYYRAEVITRDNVTKACIVKEEK